jgi:hypothetical protein
VITHALNRMFRVPQAEPLAAQAAEFVGGLRRLAVVMINVPVGVSVPGAVGEASVAVLPA